VAYRSGPAAVPLVVMPPPPRGSPAAAGRGLDAAPLEQHQVGGAVAAGHARLVARPDLVPVVAGLGAARSAGVVHGAVFTLRRWRDTNGVSINTDDVLQMHLSYIETTVEYPVRYLIRLYEPRLFCPVTHPCRRRRPARGRARRRARRPGCRR